MTEAEIQYQLALDERARRLVARLRADKVLMARLDEAQAARFRNDWMRYDDLKRKNG